MGEMNVKGYAEKKIECDIVEYTLSFHAEGRTAAAALGAVNNELERFLTLIEEKGIQPDLFRIEENSTKKRYYSDNNDRPFEAVRKVSLTLRLDSAAVNWLLHFLSENGFKAESEEEYICSILNEQHKELLQLAVGDSKEKAELLANSLGKKLLGIKQLKTNSDISDEHIYKEIEIPTSADFACKSKSSRSSHLSSPVLYESEEIDITWLIED
ncbi:MAG: SIMPL domain-containing protein [Oscillospiraceae bacterium]|nr:SIMPL domain-containing protein [Oscillospiraceae bacterium]